MKNLLSLSLLVFGLGLLAACQTTREVDDPPNEPVVPDIVAGDDLPIGVPRAAADKKEANDTAIAENRMKLGQSRQDVAAKWSRMTFEEFEGQVPRESGTNHYIVNGDVVISDKKHLQEFFENEVQNSEPVTAGLIVHAPGGVQAVWSNTQKRNLVYCVSNSFGTNKSQVVTAMASAAAVWEQQGDVDFVYSDIQDSNCTAANAQVVFDVRPVNGQTYLARAFFPDDVRSNRNVLINDSAFGLGSGKLSLAGILRHELGHTLGFRHEHTRPEAGTCFEDPDFVPLTEYDAFSVMHYPQCNGRGDWSLMLTALDSAGIACLYGAGPNFSGDMNDCLNPPAAPPSSSCSCGPQTVTKSGSVARNATVSFGPFSIAEGTAFKAAMSGSGDPDLYVRFNNPPDLASYDCRPFLTGAAETCDLTVPENATRAHVIVRGYAAGTYQLLIEHTQ